ncbi:OLC1v1035060C1 [Oldenlandia corymbosa var. corymbosa]|uniref:Pectinesterase n=1 Tax=Oldenlandia corymbosa var. corymbosa TaxID=529605 RepID=A0AAV1CST6_OLDCO|nr:OLC1v1035060C1 [Oldenlandia corymbosa var. corymbosa]
MKPYCLLLFSTVFLLTTLLVNSASSSSPDLDSNLSAIKSLCKSTPHADACLDSLKLSVSISLNPDILSFLLHSLEAAVSEAGKLSTLFSNSHSSIVEKQKGTLQDCSELHQITLSSLKKSLSKISSSSNSRQLTDARAFLSAALTNKATCLEGLNSASGSSKPSLINSINYSYKYVTNALSLLSQNKQSGDTTTTTSTSAKSSKINGKIHRRLMGFPSWISAKDRRILEGSDGEEEDDAGNNGLTVAADGTGDFTTINDAINSAPNNSADRIIIYVKQGIYQENVEIPSWKPNIVLIGDGSDVTTITGSRSVADGWTTFRSATLAVSGEGFLARDIKIENTAGPEKGQAVALRINADLAAVYRCTIKGYQDTLYVHSFRQFYRECDIYGTIDYIFGNAAVVLQGCNVISRLPLPGQSTVITAQSRDDPNELTGISLQNCSILPTVDLDDNAGSVKSYLGRPWRNFSTVVVMESYIDEHIAPEGWTPWSQDDVDSLSTLYYGEYNNNGPGSGTDNRVGWPGYHVMSYDDASTFTVSYFITGDEWLDSTSFPYDNGV